MLDTGKSKNLLTRQNLGRLYKGLLLVLNPSTIALIQITDRLKKNTSRNLYGRIGFPLQSFEDQIMTKYILKYN